MFYGILQFTLNITFCYVFYRCKITLNITFRYVFYPWKSWDIYCWATFLINYGVTRWHFSIWVEFDQRCEIFQGITLERQLKWVKRVIMWLFRNGIYNYYFSNLMVHGVNGSRNERTGVVWKRGIFFFPTRPLPRLYIPDHFSLPLHNKITCLQERSRPQRFLLSSVESLFSFLHSHPRNKLSAVQLNHPWLALSLTLRFSLLLSPTDSPTLPPGTPFLSLSSVFNNFFCYISKAAVLGFICGGREFFSFITKGGILL